MAMAVVAATVMATVDRQNLGCRMPALISEVIAIVTPTIVITADDAIGSHREISGLSVLKRDMNRRA
jgi:hypothetical protein